MMPKEICTAYIFVMLTVNTINSMEHIKRPNPREEQLHALITSCPIKRARFGLIKSWEQHQKEYPLHAAAACNDQTTYIELILKGWNPHQKDSCNKTPLDWAYYYNHTLTNKDRAYLSYANTFYKKSEQEVVNILLNDLKAKLISQQQQAQCFLKELLLLRHKVATKIAYATLTGKCNQNWLIELLVKIALENNNLNFIRFLDTTNSIVCSPSSMLPTHDEKLTRESIIRYLLIRIAITKKRAIISIINKPNPPLWIMHITSFLNSFLPQ